MKNLIVFKNPNFGELKVFMQSNEIMFNAYDIAKCAGCKNPEKTVFNFCDNPITFLCKNSDEIKNFVYINQESLNEYLKKMNSKIDFALWIKEEVIPCVIRKNTYTKEEFLKYINYLL